MTLKIGSLCSGFGGLDLAAMSVLDAEVQWHAEIDPDANQVLDYHWPGVPNHGDLTAANWAAVEPIDMLTAGFPCQDVSVAGRRQGLRPGTRTGLWHEIVRAIAVLRPRLVFLENVPGLMNGAVVDEPTDRCLCGWPYRRGGLHRDQLPQERLRGTDRRGDDGEGPTNPGSTPEALRRVGASDTRSDGPVGSLGLLDSDGPSGSGFPSPDRADVEAEVRAGGRRHARRGDPREPASIAGWPTALLDGRSTSALRDFEGADSRAESEGAIDPATGRWTGSCPFCGRSIGDRPSGPVFRSGLGTVLGTLASFGYVGRYRLLRASDVGAPHRRERWFCLARLASDSSGVGHGYAWAPRESGVPAAAVGGPATDAECGSGSGNGLPFGGDGPSAHGGRQAVPGRCGGLVADSEGDRWDEGRTEPAGFVGGPDVPVSGNGFAADSGGPGLEDRHLEQHGQERPAAERGGLSASSDADGCASRPKRDSSAPGDSEEVNEHLRDDVDGLGLDFGPYTAAIRRWERVVGRTAPAPTEPGRNGQPRLNPRFVEWMLGLSDGWVTAVPGLSRNAMLRLLGNGVVPQQGAAAFEALLAAALAGEVAA